ncbi:hypothetical protein B0H63DRAFT_483995 [Podospora didyma]|uniref:Uncharacterized protein n=1 Tax=Podospora didyma TaxID=330526 RepID=A0AAE0K9S2_9PEZI|nr:hypothetical protein B0H63DRAFT_483995 [Podospora didyma]
MMMPHIRASPPGSTTPVSMQRWLALAAVAVPSLAAAAEVTNGPFAKQTIWSEGAYITAAKCAAGCLVYNGIYSCWNKGIFYDLGVALECGYCDQINGCYCDANRASSATSYITSCVKKACSGGGMADWDKQVTSMLGLYDGYCATANVPQSSASFVLPTTGGTKAAPTAAAAAGGGGGNTGTNTTPGATPDPNAAKQTDASSSAATGGASKEEDKKGLSQSDIVALAASLGVGIPSLIIAAITLCVQLKKRKRQRAADETSTLVGIPSKPSSLHDLGGHPPTTGTPNPTPPLPQGGPYGQYPPPPEPRPYAGNAHGVNTPDLYQEQQPFVPPPNHDERGNGGYGRGVEAYPLQQRNFRY